MQRFFTVIINTIQQKTFAVAGIHFVLLSVLLIPLSAQAQKKKAIDTTPFSAALEVPAERMREAVNAYLFPEGITVPQPFYEVVSKTKEDGYERWLIRYRVDEGEYVNGWLLLPEQSPLRNAEGKLPLVLALHGTSAEGKNRAINLWDTPATDEKEQKMRDSRGFGLALVKRGFAVFAPDRLAFGERSPVPGSIKYWETMPTALKQLQERNPDWRLMGKNVWDLQRALDFLVTMESIDSERISAMGHSLGAWDTTMLMPVDERIKAAVISHTGPLRWRPAVWENPRSLERFIEVPTLKQQGAEVNQNVFYMLMAPRPVYLIWSIADAYDQPPGIIEGLRTISTYNQYLAERDNVPFDFNFYLHGAGHTFPSEAHAASFLWLEERMK